MLTQAVLAGVEAGLNRVLRLDASVPARLAPLAGRVIAVDCPAPAVQLFVLPELDGLRLAAHWEAPADCRLRAPATSLLRLAVSRDKTSILHGPEVELEGDSGLLLELAGILQDLELDWEYELARWLGPLPAALLGGHLRLRARWALDGLDSLRQSLADYLSEESRSLVGRQEAEARFAELDDLKLALDRLEARVERLSSTPASDDPA
ncbi:ubiquinone biosynthesis accessory factor UbiJ [Zestomonas thermotolerans]|uniref:ubiquinone biosynthesis accessory factor UbiJ n=1 Tax=Zestomonas thermotolerans TaxID=157784 RepID=UPI0023EFBCE3|nr:SCP2 sterol-binding domain-containing protein [Pseudomonas thermotolerans]